MVSVIQDEGIQEKACPHIAAHPFLTWYVYLGEQCRFSLPLLFSSGKEAAHTQGLSNEDAEIVNKVIIWVIKTVQFLKKKLLIWHRVLKTYI